MNLNIRCMKHDNRLQLSGQTDEYGELTLTVETCPICLTEAVGTSADKPAVIDDDIPF